MSRFLRRGWPGTCLLAALLTYGCQHKQCCCPNYGSCGVSSTIGMGAPVPANPAPAPSPPTPVLDAVPGAGQAALPAAPANPLLPPVSNVPGLNMVKVNPNPAMDPLLSEAPPPVSGFPARLPAEKARMPATLPPAASLTPTAYQPSPLAASLPQAAVTPSSSVPKYAHDASYHRLVGMVDYSHIQEAWVLRYVPVEEDDRYGGCVTLVLPDRTNLKRGQTIRVEGALIDPESQQLRPAFQVETVQPE